MSFEFTTKTGKGEDATSHDGVVELGTSAKDAIGLFGDEVVYGLYVQQAVVRAQAVVRSMIRGGSGGKEINKYLSTWRPDTKRTPTTDPAAAALRNFGKLSHEEQLEAIKNMKASMV